ncbi:PREDICTED: uncharacterized protein LOC109213424 [Nicotiana attenuata]|uniref:uncharacterized protein LOC109213424 n=1 Tax=Nicotiana attenuata TaxID=49451 RepID=UPI0009049FC4|nr:PREDICTED: uncharacterized protein LOC109213424 [Nicotiana attenuata]
MAIETSDGTTDIPALPPARGGSSLISIKLTGIENYALWNSSMRENCNAIVLSWIMNYISNELLSGMVYATIAQKTNSQGISSVSVYLRAEFDPLMPCPGCGCEESKKYVEQFESQRLL